MIAAAALAVVLVVAAVLYWRASAAATTRSVVAPPGSFPQPAAAPTTVPAGFAPSWQQPSRGTVAPLVVGPAVVTADAGVVAGRDAAGTERWSYSRTAEICTAASGFGQVLALYRNRDGTACSEFTALDAGSGARRAQSNPVAYPGVRLIGNGTLVAATGPVTVTVMRSDLVKTTEYGDVETPAQPNRQPRAGCEYGSFAMTPGALAVLERCADEGGVDRLTVLRPDGGPDASTPDVVVSGPLSGARGQLVAASGDRVAVAKPGPARIEVLDGAANVVSSTPVAVPDADAGTDPPDGVPRTSSDDGRVYWWSGSATVALDRAGLGPLWTLPATLGAGVRYGDALLVPVPAGLAVVDPASGVVARTIAVDRGGWTGPVALDVLGATLLEQRGPTLAALAPA